MAVIYTEELLSRANTWLSTPLNQRRSPEGLRALAALYTDLTGESAGSCRQCQFSDFNSAVGSYSREAQRFLHPETVANSTYTLASPFQNEQLVHEKYGKVVSAENLTDKDAEFFIENGYKHAFLKNGKPLSDEADKDETPKLTEKEQAQADYKAAYGEDPDQKLTIKELKEATSKKVAAAPAGNADTATTTGAVTDGGDQDAPSDIVPK